MTAPWVSPEVRERLARAIFGHRMRDRDWSKISHTERDWFLEDADACLAVLADAGLIRGETAAPVTGSGSWSCCLHPGCCLQRDHAGPHHVVVAYNPTTGQL